jgi:hypothetical protein
MIPLGINNIFLRDRDGNIPHEHYCKTSYEAYLPDNAQIDTQPETAKDTSATCGLVA